MLLTVLRYYQLGQYSDWASGWTTKESGTIPGKDKKYFLFCEEPRLVSGPPNRIFKFVIGHISAAEKLA